MQEQDGIGYREFAKWERELARRKAKAKEKALEWTSINKEDLEQEFLLQIWLKRRAYKSSHESHASLRTFINRVLENRFLDILKAEYTDKRKAQKDADWIHRELNPDDEDTMTLEEKLPDKSIPEPQDPRLDIQRAFEKAISHLTRFQRGLIRRIQAGESLSDISKALKIPWSTLKAEVVRMRQVLYDAGLADFVEPGEFPEKPRKGQ